MDIQKSNETMRMGKGCSNVDLKACVKWDFHCLEIEEFGSLGDKSFKNNLFLGLVMVGLGMKVAINVGPFPINLVGEEPSTRKVIRTSKKGRE